MPLNNPEPEGYIPPDEASQLLAYIKRLERRIEDLETGEPLRNSSLSGGAIAVFNDNNRQVGRLGLGTRVSNSGVIERPVFAVSEDSVDNRFLMLVDTVEGIIRPKQIVQFIEDTFVIVTSSSFTNVYKAFVAITSKIVYVKLIVNCPSGTTGEIRLELGTNFTDAISIPENSSASYEFKWDISSIMNFNSEVDLRVEARRVSGSGNLLVFAPDAAYFETPSRMVDATSTGIPA